METKWAYPQLHSEPLYVLTSNAGRAITEIPRILT